MQGQFTAMVIDDLGLGDAPFLEAIKNQDIDGLLKRHPIVQKTVTPNQIYQTALEYLMELVFGLPSTGAHGSIGSAGMRMVVLTTKSAEGTYTEYTGVYYWSDSGQGPSHGWCHAYNLSKNFYQQRSEPTRIWIDPDREGYYYRDRFLWLPSDGAFNNIRSIEMYGGENASWTGTTSSQNHWRGSATRLKDSGGNPITLQKTANQGFLVEYVVKLFSR